MVQFHLGPSALKSGYDSQATFGAVAQLGERLLCKQEVAGSIPVCSIKFRAARPNQQISVL